MWVRGYSRSLKVVPFESLGTVSYSPSIVTMAVYVATLEIFSIKNGLTLKSWFGVVQGHWKWRGSIDHVFLLVRHCNYSSILYHLRVIWRLVIPWPSEIWLRSHSRSLKLVPFKSLGAVSYSPSIVTMAVSVVVCKIFSVKEWCDLENRVKVRSRSLEMAPFDRSHTSSYSPSNP